MKGEVEMGDREQEDVNSKVVDSILVGNLAAVKNLFETKNADIHV